MKRIALKCTCSNDMYNADFDYALVELTPELIASIEKRRAVFMAAKASDPSVSDVRFLDYSPQYFSARDLDGISPQTAMVEALISGESEIEEVPEFFEPKEESSDGDFRTICDRMVVSEYSVTWTCSPRHCDFTIETCEFTYKDIAEMERAQMEVVQ